MKSRQAQPRPNYIIQHSKQKSDAFLDRFPNWYPVKQ